MLRMVGAGVIGFSCVCIGTALTKHLKHRIQILLELIRVLESVAMEAGYELEVLPSIFRNMAKCHNGIVGNWLEYLGDELDSGNKNVR